jgi:hypothetical protein
MTDTDDLQRWRELYRALAWLLNDYIGVSGTVTNYDFKQIHPALGYAHEGYHNAQRVLWECKPPVPWSEHPYVRCVCHDMEMDQYAGTPHRHYDDPPYSCARCDCQAYTPVSS